MTQQAQTTADYRFPEKVNNMTMHLPLGIKCQDPQEYLQKKGYCLAGDLLLQRFPPRAVEQAVQAGEIKFANWPEKSPRTQFFWALQSPKMATLEKLAAQAVKFCYGGEDEPIGGNFMTVGAEMGSQQQALAGLIYARTQGEIVEYANLGSPAKGPVYIKAGSFSHTMMKNFLGDKKQA